MLAITYKVGSVNYFASLLLITQECMVTLIKVSFPRIRSKCTQRQNPRPGYNPLLSCLDDIFKRLLSMTQGCAMTLARLISLRLGSYYAYKQNQCLIWIIFQEFMSMTEGCVITFTQGHISKVKFTVNT